MEVASKSSVGIAAILLVAGFSFLPAAGADGIGVGNPVDGTMTYLGILMEGEEDQWQGGVCAGWPTEFEVEVEVPVDPGTGEAEQVIEFTTVTIDEDGALDVLRLTATSQEPAKASFLRGSTCLHFDVRPIQGTGPFLYQITCHTGCVEPVLPPG